MAIYSRFGSKGGVFEALFDEGLARLVGAQRSVSDELQPLEAIEAMCLAFRGAALQHSGHYWLVFGPPLKDFRPSEAAQRRALRSFEEFVRAIARAIRAGSLAGQADPIALELFATCHGHVTLAIADRLPSDHPPEVAYREAVRRVLSSYAVTA